MDSINSTWLAWCREYKKKSYTPMVAQTHKLFLKEKSIAKVAKLRGVNNETIERQLIMLIVKGILSVDDCVNREVKNEIYITLEDYDLVKLRDIKNNVSKEITWFEIKACVASKGINA